MAVLRVMAVASMGITVLTLFSAVSSGDVAAATEATSDLVVSELDEDVQWILNPGGMAMTLLTAAAFGVALTGFRKSRRWR